MTSMQWVNAIQTGDSLEVLKDLPENSVHAIVTDPPYGLAFMGRDWDDFEPREYQEWCENWARRARRVLRPGGHLLAFSGNRTHHRLFSGVEDAGYEVRDTITWHYGSGFPKALDVSKAIDKAEDADREVVGEREADDMRGGNFGQQDSVDDEKDGEKTTYEYTAPATDAAQKWQGWKTCLKPASEFVVVARNPLGEDTVAENVMEWGTGALNIDGTRLASGDGGGRVGENTAEKRYAENGSTDMAAKPGPRGGSSKGRYPSNVVFDALTARELDREVGDTAGGHYPSQSGESELYGDKSVPSDPGVDIDTDDSGGPSRYFYTSKASRSERTEDGAISNDHPTVKPVDLMEWLVRLVTREGQTVLDPFAGSGTTCKAAKQLGRKFAGIERQAKYADLARVRCGLTPDDPSVVRDDDNQRGMEDWL